MALDDELQEIANEVIRNGLADRIHIGLDFFDASINRVAAWVIGMRNMQKALLRALLEPTAVMKQLELDGDYTARLAYLEEMKAMPWQAVWDEFCERQSVPTGLAWLDEVRGYETNILAERV